MLARAFVFFAGSFSRITFWLVVILCSYWLFFFKLQDTAFTLLPAENTTLASSDYDIFATFIILLWVAHVFRVRTRTQSTHIAANPIPEHLTLAVFLVTRWVRFYTPKPQSMFSSSIGKKRKVLPKTAPLVTTTTKMISKLDPIICVPEEIGVVLIAAVVILVRSE